MATNIPFQINDKMKVDTTTVSTTDCQRKDLGNLKLLFRVSQYEQRLLTKLGITINKCKKIIFFLLI